MPTLQAQRRRYHVQLMPIPKTRMLATREAIRTIANASNPQAAQTSRMPREMERRNAGARQQQSDRKSSGIAKSPPKMEVFQSQPCRLVVSAIVKMHGTAAKPAAKRRQGAAKKSRGQLGGESDMTARSTSFERVVRRCGGVHLRRWTRMFSVTS